VRAVKLVEMRQWVPEAVNTAMENETLIQGIVNDLKGAEPGQYAVSVGGDTLIFASIDDESRLCLYECTIRRATTNITDENIPDGCVPAARTEQRPS
jgi:hypothetical protein